MQTRLAGRHPKFHHAALIPQAQELLAAEHSEALQAGQTPICEAHPLDAESLEGNALPEEPGELNETAPFCLLLLGQPTLRYRLRQRVDRAGSTDRGPLRDRRAHPDRDPELRAAPFGARGPLRHAVLR